MEIFLYSVQECSGNGSHLDSDIFELEMSNLPLVQEAHLCMFTGKQCGII